MFISEDSQISLIRSFNKVCNSLSLCFVYLELFYKPFQKFIYYWTRCCHEYSRNTARWMLNNMQSILGWKHKLESI